MKTYLCIGAGEGISLATAKRFADEGYQIVLASRSAAERIRLGGELSAYGTHVKYEFVDAADAKQLSHLVEKYIKEELDVVHYNAGVLHYDPAGNLVMASVDKQAPQDIEKDISINITGALLLLSKVIPVMTQRGSGTILLTGGGLAVDPYADLLTLSVGKAGIRVMTQALFEPLKAQGVHIASVRVSTLVSADPSHPANIADAFWELHTQEKQAWTWETIYPAQA
ncbi:SDR family NAD(P)-dependent oxidoreductase [Rheinheimera sp. MM224]|uniref:SDR family NAD(P)-dependent oxidoreductase n=1 Tax=Rheinheimera sp. MM224 TaxID=3019969 RepID=UPI0021F90843|nr:SDR family NAD(P)-dependent oxidoreductase [Rheinheimera sp. MM224]CAI3798313.1 2,5-dichloro-2,5-cyclohexadiene-1,4-diol dehydrogenase LinX [Rheinheimera sp. MM224]